MARGRNVVDMVVARLPSPDKLMKRSGGGRPSSSYDSGGDDSDVGYASAVQDFAKGIGAKVDDEEAAISALKDFVRMCIHEEASEEASEDEQGDD